MTQGIDRNERPLRYEVGPVSCAPENAPFGVMHIQIGNGSTVYLSKEQARKLADQALRYIAGWDKYEAQMLSTPPEAATKCEIVDRDGFSITLYRLASGNWTANRPAWLTNSQYEGMPFSNWIGRMRDAKSIRFFREETVTKEIEVTR